MVKKKEIVNGEIVRIRKGHSRTNLPVVLPDNPTYLKQSNIVTLMAGDFKTLQIRVIISVIEKLQDAIEKSITYFNQHGTSIPCEQLSLFENDRLVIQIAFKDLGVSPEQYSVVKSTIKKLITIPVEFDVKDPNTGEDGLIITGLFSKTYIPKTPYARHFTLEMDKNVAAVFLNVDKGFTRYIKEIACKAQSRYTVRMYMLISSWKERGGFSIYTDKFRKFLKLEDKYPNFKDLYRRIIRPVYDDLFENADCWFEMAEVYRTETDTQPYKLNFKIIKSALSKKENEFLDSQKENIQSMCIRHFKMKNGQIQEILNKVTLDNYLRVVNKMVFLCEYLKDHWNTIQSIPDYCHVALLRELLPEEGLIGEAET